MSDHTEHDFRIEWTADFRLVRSYAQLFEGREPQFAQVSTGRDQTGEYLEYRNFLFGMAWRARVVDETRGIWQQDLWALSPLGSPTAWFDESTTPLPLEVLVETQPPLRTLRHGPTWHLGHPGPAGRVPLSSWHSEGDREFIRRCAASVFQTLDFAAIKMRWVAPWEDHFGFTDGWIMLGVHVTYAEAHHGPYRLTLAPTYAEPTTEEPVSDEETTTTRWTLMVTDVAHPVDATQDAPTAPGRPDFAVRWLAATGFDQPQSLQYRELIALCTRLLGELAPYGTETQPVPAELLELARRR